MSTHELVKDMTLQEKYGRLSAMISALSEEKRILGEQLLAQATNVGIKSFASPAGAVSVVQKAPSISFTESGLERLAQTLPADQCMTIPRPFAQQMALKRLDVDGEDLVDRVSGEIVDWAVLGGQSAPYLSWPSSTDQKQAKEDACTALRVALNQVLDPRRLTELSRPAGLETPPVAGSTVTVSKKSRKSGKKTRKEGTK